MFVLSIKVPLGKNLETYLMSLVYIFASGVIVIVV